MKSFLTTTALFEGTTGLALAIMPSMVATLLLGTSLTDISAILIARLAGAALITIAIACWLFRNNPQSGGLVKAMLVYNVLSIILLGYALFVAKIAWPGLWPAALMHVGLLVWSILLLRKQIV
jgi:CHASE2 domain-containing sensor protein